MFPECSPPDGLDFERDDESKQREEDGRQRVFHECSLNGAKGSLNVP
jgi:hypothetical protein